MDMVERIARTLAAEDYDIKAWKGISDEAYHRAIDREWVEWADEANAVLVAFNEHTGLTTTGVDGR